MKEETTDVLGESEFVELIVLKVSVLERLADDEGTTDVLGVLGSAELMFDAGVVEESKFGELCEEPIDAGLSSVVERGLVVVDAEVVEESKLGALDTGLSGVVEEETRLGDWFEE